MMLINKIFIYTQDWDDGSGVRDSGWAGDTPRAGLS